MTLWTALQLLAALLALSVILGGIAGLAQWWAGRVVPRYEPRDYAAEARQLRIVAAREYQKQAQIHYVRVADVVSFPQRKKD